MGMYADLFSAASLSGIINVANGGTGRATLTAGAVLVGNGTSPVAMIGPLTDGQLLIGNTAGVNPTPATLTAGAGITVLNAAGAITISAASTSFTWSTITASQTLAINNGYVCVSAGGALALLLPPVAAVGSVIEVTLDGATSWTVTQAAGQQVRLGVSQTTAGAGGSLASTAQGNSIRLVCSVANLKFNVISSIGNITVV